MSSIIIFESRSANDRTPSAKHLLILGSVPLCGLNSAFASRSLHLTDQDGDEVDGARSFLSHCSLLRQSGEKKEAFLDYLGSITTRAANDGSKHFVNSSSGRVVLRPLKHGFGARAESFCTRPYPAILFVRLVDWWSDHPQSATQNWSPKSYILNNDAMIRWSKVTSGVAFILHPAVAR
jgi:hypothetical protein